jgi:hypothetical protein
MVPEKSTSWRASVILQQLRLRRRTLWTVAEVTNSLLNRPIPTRTRGMYYYFGRFMASGPNNKPHLFMMNELSCISLSLSPLSHRPDLPCPSSPLTKNPSSSADSANFSTAKVFFVTVTPLVRTILRFCKFFF